MDLADFLLARIAEDEERGRNCQDWSECDEDYGCPAHMAPGRWTAECDAKRRIVEGHAKTWDLGREDYLEGVWRSEDHAIRLLAAVYADHPDYRSEWRP